MRKGFCFSFRFAWMLVLMSSLAVSGCGEGATGAENTGATLAPPAPPPPPVVDTTSPSIQITSPSGNITVTTNSTTLSGTASDNVGVTQVTWRNATTNASGTATGSGNWSALNIPLQSGGNTLTVTARDAAGNQASASRTVTYSPPPPPPVPDTTSPSVSITSPSGNVTVTTNSTTLSGTASDNVGVTQVTWRNATTNASGTATGLNSWSATSIPLQSGSNTLTVTARDAAGNQTSASRVVTYTVATTSSVNLTWESPTTNTDQSCLSNLSGYIVSYGTSPGTYTAQETISVNSLSCSNTGTTTACGNVQSCSYTVRGLSRGQWFFTTTAYTSGMALSTPSNEAAVTLD